VGRPLFSPDLLPASAETFPYKPSETQRLLKRLESGVEAPKPGSGDVYVGKKVIWLGRAGEMVRVTADELRATPDNLFDLSQLVATATYMKEGGAVFEAPPARVDGVVDEAFVDDTKSYQADGELFKYAGMTRAFTKGDLGTLVFSLRNGNHRAFAAFLAGEPFVWIWIKGERDLADPLVAGRLE
jgi:hypothetical protein